MKNVCSAPLHARADPQGLILGTDTRNTCLHGDQTGSSAYLIGTASFSLGAMLPRREAHITPSSTGFKYTTRQSSSPLHIGMERCLIKAREQFRLYFVEYS